MKNKAGLVALIVLAAATALMVFFVLPNIGSKTENPPAESKTEPATTAPAADAKGNRPAAEGQAATPEAQPQAATGENKPAEQAATPEAQKPAADPTAAWTVPSFDILRVEPDGSTVIAGRAQPGTKLEIVSGDKVVATADVSAAGDFAAVFDQPLNPGDYQLTLRSLEGNLAKSSEEVATVSIPTDKSGELLAMVSKPGVASRILTAPKEAVASQPTPAESAAGKPALAASSETAATTTEEPAAKPAAGTGAAVATPPPAGTGAIAVSAVELEGTKIFVAGTANPGALVRVYADDRLVGETKTDDQGRFVVDGALELSVGQHTIRADMMAEDKTTVTVRVAVPFDRPEGDQVAAVAQPSANGAIVPFDGGAFDGLRLEAGKALNLLKGLFANGKVPSGEELAAARSATEIALGSLADFKAPDGLDAGVKDMVAKTSKAAADALALLKGLPKDPQSVSTALGSIETAVGSALMPRTDGAGGVVAHDAKPAEQTPAPETAAGTTAQAPASETPVASGTATDQAATPPAAAQTTGQPASQATPETVQQAPLTESKTSVIIRRGDTLWQISRRVYGAGVRYTTIYMANEDQITDPDRIRPGQIFGVPDKAMPDAESEEIHRKHMKHLP
ncbi:MULTISPECIES: LysM peptidoglycan-binding domain-containing protein [unclassified Rhizobium]|uniref:LysM peptidoglycan-binding domain-containing protein n=1 Tax=unclassified Rhizobium TaxID=2613769 RepID=UPI0006FBA147|nr:MULTISPECIES: LysM peptidoglycan-binding domain-containing protein [unclassified Rhizobium]KQV44523.1 peptidoglycan-binding protein LysM [Rhizobium sp. Root1212]KRD37605.1 peptidoglycan-binding protein LysM [Rhizobium sp. Root268]